MTAAAGTGIQGFDKRWEQNTGIRSQVLQEIDDLAQNRRICIYC